MLRKKVTQILAAIMLLIASFALVAPSSAYAQGSTSHPQSVEASSKCDKIKDKQKKKACEQKEKQEKKKKKDDKKGDKKNDDGPNHDANDDHGDHGDHDSSHP